MDGVNSSIDASTTREYLLTESATPMYHEVYRCFLPFSLIVRHFSRVDMVTKMKMCRLEINPL